MNKITIYIKKLEEDCYQELYHYKKAATTSLGIFGGLLLSNAALWVMGVRMPQTEEEILQIAGVTEASYNMCGGKGLLEITQRYRKRKEGKVLELAFNNYQFLSSFI